MEVNGVDQIERGDWQPANSTATVAEPSAANSTTSQRKRAPVACRRCRRLRSKCVHESANPPCKLCRAAGQATAAACVFIGRSWGGGDRQTQLHDRSYRSRRHGAADEIIVAHPTAVVTTSNKPSRPYPTEVVLGSPIQLSPLLSPRIGASSDPWELLPPFDEVVEGCRTFFTAVFQLGFLPKAIFLEQLTKNRTSLSFFLVLSVLSLSARFTKCLTKRYGDATKAADHFISLAGDLIHNEIYNPTLERTQALFLLSVAEWTQGNRSRSAIHMGIAVRMAGILRLHREETYFLAPNATTEEIISLEVARRTFWVLESQDHLYSGHNAAVSFPLNGITALLPSDETDFAYGIIPKERAALGGTQPAQDEPSLPSLQSRSPFATLIQTYNRWGEIARRAGRASRSEREKADKKIKPWEMASEYSQLTRSLKEWEDTVPQRHRWSLINLRGHKAESLDLAYLSHVMVRRLCNIVIRRLYLEDILESKLGMSSSGYAVPEFWTQMSHELFTNVFSLSETFETWFSLRIPDEGIPSIIVFCVYICGSLASYLWKWPQLCPQLADGAEAILKNSLDVMAAMRDHLPHVSQWLVALQKIAVALPARNAFDAHGGFLQPEKDFAATSSNSAINDPQHPVNESQDSTRTEMRLDENAPGLNETIDNETNNGQGVSNSIHFAPEVLGDDLTWTNDVHTRAFEGAGEMSSLDFISGYSFDEELMRLLVGEL